MQTRTQGKDIEQIQNTFESKQKCVRVTSNINNCKHQEENTQPKENTHKQIFKANKQEHKQPITAIANNTRKKNTQKKKYIYMYIINLQKIQKNL